MNPARQLPTAEAWRAFVARCHEPLEGVVTELVSFGAFVRFDEGVDGLLPTAQAHRDLTPGERLTVRVLQLDPDKRRVSLQQV